MLCHSELLMKNSEFYTYPQNLISGDSLEKKKCEKINYVYK